MDDPSQTLPEGFGDPRFAAFIASKLDTHFAGKAAALHHHYRSLCKAAAANNLSLLSWSYARAAEYWRGVARRYTKGR
jgi:hypothetical protein